MENGESGMARPGRNVDPSGEKYIVSRIGASTKSQRLYRRLCHAAMKLYRGGSMPAIGNDRMAHHRIAWGQGKNIFKRR